MMPARTCAVALLACLATLPALARSRHHGTPPAPAHARQPDPAAGLMKLDPSARFEQLCDIEAMTRIGRDRTGFKPDRALAYALADPALQGDVLSAKGAAFRSGGKWYHLSFTCKATPDRTHVVTFDYHVGDPIPQQDWQDHGLTE